MEYLELPLHQHLKRFFERHGTNLGSLTTEDVDTVRLIDFARYYIDLGQLEIIDQHFLNTILDNNDLQQEILALVAVFETEYRPIMPSINTGKPSTIKLEGKEPITHIRLADGRWASISRLTPIQLDNLLSIRG